MRQRIAAAVRPFKCEDCECPPCATCQKRSPEPLARPLREGEVYYCAEHQPELTLRCSKCGPKPLAEFTEAAQEHAAKYYKYGDTSNKKICLQCIAESDVKECQKCKKSKHKDLFGRTEKRTIKSICLECENAVNCRDDVEMETKTKKQKTDVYPTCAVCQQQAKVAVKAFSEKQPWYCALSLKKNVINYSGHFLFNYKYV